MTAVRQLTVSGIEVFDEFLNNLKADPDEPRPAHLLGEPGYSEPFLPPVDIDSVRFADRLEAARYLESRLGGIARERVDANASLWSWLALFYFDQLRPAGKRPGESYRYTLATGGGTHELWHAYRHLLASPFLIYRTTMPHPSSALLCGPVSEHGELSEQLASSMDLITNPAIVEVADVLYFDQTAGLLKRGSAGKGPGSSRRLVAVIQQLDLTYDLYQLSASDIISLLPAEFDRWKP